MSPGTDFRRLSNGVGDVDFYRRRAIALRRAALRKAMRSCLGPPRLARREPDTAEVARSAITMLQENIGKQASRPIARLLTLVRRIAGGAGSSFRSTR